MITKNPIENFNKKFDVVSVFIEHNGETLLVQRQGHKPQGNTWAMVAGKVDEGEELAEALAREVEEEIGLKFAPTDYKYFDNYFVRYPNYDYVYHIFHLNLDERPVIDLNLEEHKDHIWVRPEKALQMELIQDEDFCIKTFFGIE